MRARLFLEAKMETNKPFSPHWDLPSFWLTNRSGSTLHVQPYYPHLSLLLLFLENILWQRRQTLILKSRLETTSTHTHTGMQCTIGICTQKKERRLLNVTLKYVGEGTRSSQALEISRSKHRVCVYDTEGVTWSKAWSMLSCRCSVKRSLTSISSWTFPNTTVSCSAVSSPALCMGQ